MRRACLAMVGAILDMVKVMWLVLEGSDNVFASSSIGSPLSVHD
jgi:hypothetical protein